MAVGRINLEYEKKKQFFEKRTTPFSIDDILSGNERLKTKPFASVQNDSMNENLPKFLSGSTNNGLTDFYLNLMNHGNQDAYAKWLADFYRLYAANAFQPFWLTTLNSHFSLNYSNPQTELPQSEVKSKFYRNRILNKNHHSFYNEKRLKYSRLRREANLTHPNEEKVTKEQRKSPNAVSCASCSRNQTKIAEDRSKLKQTLIAKDSPLSALEKLTCVTFKELEHKQNVLHVIANGREAKMKRRKCRTAFTAFQLSVLEQRFHCHKYLTPADRDQLAQLLDLSAPQVITWFQNRRAKQKRDLEELKNDIKTVKTWDDALSEASYSLAKTSDDENVEIDIEGC